MSQPLFVRIEPPLVRVLEGGRERGHDFAAVTQISTNFSPLLVLANALKTTSDFDGLLKLVQIQRTLVDRWETVQMGAILFVKLGELVEIVEVGSVACRDYKATLVKYTMNILTSFDQIDLLASSSKMEAL
jgi:hypothetical protein